MEMMLKEEPSNFAVISATSEDTETVFSRFNHKSTKQLQQNVPHPTVSLSFSRSSAERQTYFVSGSVTTCAALSAMGQNTQVGVASMRAPSKLRPEDCVSP